MFDMNSIPANPVIHHVDVSHAFEASVTPETAAIMQRNRESVALITCASCGTHGVAWDAPDMCVACAPVRPIIVGRTNHHPPPWAK